MIMEICLFVGTLIAMGCLSHWLFEGDDVAEGE